MTVSGYSSFDEMMADMKAKEEAANARVLDCQREVTWGSHYFRLWPEESPPLLICGYIMTESELDNAEKGLGADAAERWETRKRMLASHERGYRFGRHYSVVEPDGELGSVHIADIVGAITPEQFEVAELFGWQLNPIAREPWFRAGVARYLREMVEQNRNQGD